MYERPYIYVFDGGSTLTNGTAYENLVIPVQNDYAFIARRIAGLENLTAAATRAFFYYDAESRYMMQAPLNISPEWPILPGLYYPGNSQIRFNLSAVLRANHAYATPGSNPSYYDQMVFQGAKVIVGQRPYQTPYSYYEVPFTYVVECPITFTGNASPAYTEPNPPKQFQAVLQNQDFELLTIAMYVNKNGTTTWVPSDTDFKIELLDLMEFPTSNRPVLDSFINYASNTLANGFPNPTLVWPANGLIKFNITSLLVESEVPATLRMEFMGLKRMPCLGAITGGRL